MKSVKTLAIAFAAAMLLAACAKKEEAAAPEAAPAPEATQAPAEDSATPAEGTEGSVDDPQSGGDKTAPAG